MYLYLPMNLTKKTKITLVVVAAVIYVAMFIATAYCTFIVCHQKCIVCDAHCDCECYKHQSKQPARKMKTIDKCLEILAPAKNTKGKCEWLALKENAQVGPIENYFVEETKEIPADTLLKILDKQYYVEASEVVNSGIYSPMARVSYISEKGKIVTLVYSFANAQVNLYRNEEMVKGALLYNPKELKELLESLQ